MIGVTCVLTIRIVGASEYANDTTYAVASRWGGLEGASPPRPVPFWRLSATNVVDSRQKESVLGRPGALWAPPPNPHRESRACERRQPAQICARSRSPRSKHRWSKSARDILATGISA